MFNAGVLPYQILFVFGFGGIGKFLQTNNCGNLLV